jgi:hypothetical protein
MVPVRRSYFGNVGGGLPNEVLTSLVQTKNMAFVLDGLPHARICQMVVIAHDAERICAAFRATVGTDRSAAVGALRHRRLAARRPYVVISKYNLTADVLRYAFECLMF